ncbi:hypothetical protein BpHYR1_019610 [Brachionus plicatilis]|uniref:Uncharacterized protein n=1 Tax=Brachionus plicatilis TaxID=10195 RepID=A0A3M7Q404_BRAPC|nr:hypothetical protein BpHYR1_019610 [Brachionus plicatilis]
MSRVKLSTTKETKVILWCRNRNQKVVKTHLVIKKFFSCKKGGKKMCNKACCNILQNTCLIKFQILTCLSMELKLNNNHNRSINFKFYDIEGKKMTYIYDYKIYTICLTKKVINFYVNVCLSHNLGNSMRIIN